ncbi:MAG: NUDIX hydrolase [Gammaproteobacteria bacterium]|nr:NUDIX hydrolase [Gammaproteobacteria bacterium]
MPRPQTPSLTVDAIIELSELPGRPIVLIERKYPPLGWAIPGGFVDIGETVEDATVREAMEEVTLQISLKALLGCYSQPSRDPRGHTVSLVYVAEASGKPVAADDARNVQVFSIENLPEQLAFDHKAILNDYLSYRSCGQIPSLRNQ